VPPLDAAQDNPLFSAILSCPSLPNLTELAIYFPRVAFPLPTLLHACTNLRRYKLYGHETARDDPQEAEMKHANGSFAVFHLTEDNC
jgi:hypothetical protein